MQFNISFKTIFEYILKKLVLCIQIRFVSTEKTTRIASRASCYNKGSTLAENIRYLMYKYDITINDWHQSLNYVIKKSMHMTMTVPIVMIHVLQMLLESYSMS